MAQESSSQVKSGTEHTVVDNIRNNEEAVKYLTFFVEERLFAILSDQVVNIIRMQEITYMPKLPEFEMCIRDSFTAGRHLEAADPGGRRYGEPAGLSWVHLLIILSNSLLQKSAAVYAYLSRPAWQCRDQAGKVLQQLYRL